MFMNTTNDNDSGRETFLVPMIWEDDWPIINGGQKIQLQPQAPGLFLKEHDATWRDDFKDAELGLGWYRKST
jgi:beta-xylosidase